MGKRKIGICRSARRVGVNQTIIFGLALLRPSRELVSPRGNNAKTCVVYQIPCFAVGVDGVRIEADDDVFDGFRESDDVIARR